jgi:hypothetical protein
VKISQTELKIGTLIPELPILQPNDGRILPQTFEGGLLTSKEIKNLTFTGGRLDKAKDRNDTNWEDLALNNKNGRFWQFSADNLDLGGVDYKFTDRITGSYHFAQLDDIYRQHFIGMVATQPMGPGHLRRRPAPCGQRRSARPVAGKIDNTSSTAWSAMPWAGTSSAPAISTCPATAPSRMSMAATRTWSTSCRSTTSPAPTNAPGRRATTTTSRARHPRPDVHDPLPQR